MNPEKRLPAPPTSPSAQGKPGRRFGFNIGFYIALSILLLVTSVGWAQGSGWRWLTGGDLFGVRSFGQRIWIMGNVGTGLILHSTDGGQNWEIQPNITGMAFSYFSGAFTFLDQNNGWIVGGNNILRTRNGGQTWTFSPAPVNTQLRSIAVVDTMHIWASSDYGYTDSIFRTTDGGTTWQGSFVDYYINGMSFLDTLTGWAVSGIEKTTDGGVTWRHLSSPPQILCCIEMFDTLNGLIAGDPDTSYKTTDGWISWSPRHTGGRGNIRDISFQNVQSGLMAGSQGVFRTTDGG